jgi:hypothetical protein
LDSNQIVRTDSLINEDYGMISENSYITQTSPTKSLSKSKIVITPLKKTI